MDYKDLYSSLIRLHVLHAAAKAPVLGGTIIDELERNGYRLSNGTVYPLLHGLERKGYLVSVILADGKPRRVYHVTARGRKALAAGREKVHHLFHELFEDEENGGRVSSGQ